MQSIKIVFFGSTKESVIVLEKLFQYQLSNGTLSICCIVTPPPRPVGRHQELTPTPVELWAKTKNIPVLSFPTQKDKPWLYENEQTAIDSISPFKPNLIVTASYGQKIPIDIIQKATFGGLNVHPSLLPRWRGADPTPWAIMSGDTQTGVTILTIEEQFDEGKILSQKKIPILPTDTTEMLYPKLFTLGAQLLCDVLSNYLALKGAAVKGSPEATQGTPLHGLSQGKSPTPYARRLTREDGFEPWELIQKATNDATEAQRIDRKFRALTPWPGVWTKIGIMNKELGIMEEKRVKILAVHLYEDTLVIDQVQLEGKMPTPLDMLPISKVR